ncbi:hypothetical protein ACH4SP_02815 [Streptomyces sp. NPDC021093]|uniref:hypothetical protein n=1 Tax=Streptomyces sp. NPDC021093 TaxID=3365112 RepID=UPI0037931E39
MQSEETFPSPVGRPPGPARGARRRGRGGRPAASPRPEFLGTCWLEHVPPDLPGNFQDPPGGCACGQRLLHPPEPRAPCAAALWGATAFLTAAAVAVAAALVRWGG